MRPLHIAVFLTALFSSASASSSVQPSDFTNHQVAYNDNSSNVYSNAPHRIAKPFDTISSNRFSSVSNAQQSSSLAGASYFETMDMRTLQDKATDGDHHAQFFLARRLQKGIGTAINSSQAADWYYQAAQQGVAPAQLNLGFMYIKGEGVPVNERLARQWLERAVMGGDNRASYLLAVLDESQQKLIDAYSWYEISTRQEMLDDKVRNKAQYKITQLAMNLSSQDIAKAKRQARSLVNE